MDKVCTYPKCNCPFDAPSDPNWCARGYKKKGKQMDAVTPAKLPLIAGVSRCLGHGDKKLQWCDKSNVCARHLTISHELEPWINVEAPFYRMCSNNDFHCFIEVEK